ncbi:hypothetical protein MMC17_009316 [Xylographa soralifera]|nr:hypothetical protein [Xylographa soralifera]
MAVADAGTYGPNRALAAREAEAFEDGHYEVFAREAEAEPLEDEIELEIREFKEYMRKRDLFKRVWCPSIACDYAASDFHGACAAAGCHAGCNRNNKCLAPMIQGKGGKGGKSHRR